MAPHGRCDIKSKKKRTANVTVSSVDHMAIYCLKAADDRGHRILVSWHKDNPWSPYGLRISERTFAFSVMPFLTGS